MLLIQSETIQLVGDYNDDGIDELRHDIRERIKRNALVQLLYSIQDNLERKIFDPFSERPAIGGWHFASHTPDLSHNDLSRKIMVLVTPLKDGYILYVGADQTMIANTSRLIRKIFLLSLVAITPILLLI